ncbi:hypothetical protein [Mucilaginibacter sp.]
MLKKINTQDNLPKQLIWVYIVLLIFEGAIRKWILPDLATPLLLVRDPIAIWLIILAWKRGLFQFNIYVIILFVMAIIGLFTAMFWGHGNLLVAIFGVRTLILHFPLIFIIGNVFNRDDVIKVGKFIMWLTIPMTVLLLLQFYSPQSAWVNRGVGGDTTGGGFSGALGFFRASTTFSFTNGTTGYYSFAACFVFYFWLASEKYIDQRVLLASSIALLMSIPLSISRSLFFSVIVTALFVIMAVFRDPKKSGKIILVGIGVSALFLILTQVGVFQTATDVFTTRLTTANATEGGASAVLMDRYLGGMVSAITNSSNLPFFGYGIGMGTNVGSALLTGKTQFLVAEGEWGRLIGELGIFLGLTVIFIRLIVSAKIALACYRKLSLGDFLPWILLSSCLLTLPQGQWAQPTSLGFSIIGAGLTIASLRQSPILVTVTALQAEESLTT